jgi:hypothetical protein
MPLPAGLLPHLGDAELFQAINIILPAWLMLMLAPKLPLTEVVVYACTAAVCLLYVLVMASIIMGSSGEPVDFGELFSYKGVARLLAKEQTALPAWAHFAAFDL